MRDASPRQVATLAAIRETVLARGYAPTLRELGRMLGIRSTNGVEDHLKALVKKGLLVREANKARTIKLAGSAREALYAGQRALVRSVLERHGVIGPEVAEEIVAALYPAGGSR